MPLPGRTLAACCLLLLLASGASATPVVSRLPALEPLLPLLDGAAVSAFYERRDFLPAWRGPHCRQRLQELLVAIDQAFEHGLDPADYHRASLVGTMECSDSVEWLATDAWLALAAHLYGGRVDPATVEPEWNTPRRSMDLAAALEQAIAEERIGAALLGMAPDDAVYAGMREALARFRGYLGRGGWVGVDAGPTLRPGDSDPRIAQLRARLALSGLLDPALVGAGDSFDAELETAVKAFQRRANLEPDGVVGALTLEQLNRRASDRVEQLRANLERWRWLPEELGERHLRVNIADFSLQAWHEGRIEREHRVIVGRLYRRTPTFSGRISQIVLNPWWEVPHRLAVQDKLPLFKRNPGEFDRLGFELLDRAGNRVDPAGIDWQTLSARNFPYRLRQRPGAQNALGQVKILFPNPHAVYLHDTPTRGLFARVRRDFSSGCIRVEGALDLAEWLLAGRDSAAWDRSRIDAAVAGGAETPVALRPTLPVHIVYLTVVPDGNGEVRFIDDLYGRDQAVGEALARPLSPR
jgi:L,D-transpeptidase YcbB